MYSDYDLVQKFLTDKRFKIVDSYKDAKVIVLSWEYESKEFESWNIDFENTYISFFKKEGALVIKNQIANMINTTLEDKTCMQETYDLANNLPNFIGCFLDR